MRAPFGTGERCTTMFWNSVLSKRVLLMARLGELKPPEMFIHPVLTMPLMVAVSLMLMLRDTP